MYRVHCPPKNVNVSCMAYFLSGLYRNFNLESFRKKDEVFMIGGEYVCDLCPKMLRPKTIFTVCNL